MNTNENLNKKSLSKVITPLIIIVVILLVTGFAYARYITTRKGNLEAKIANWTFKVNEKTEESFQIDLAATREGFTQEANVDKNFIGPGTSGGFTIKIDTTGSQTSLVYNIDMDVSENKIPKNLLFYSDSNMSNQLYHSNNKIHIEDFIKYNANDKKIQEKTIYWRWAYETGTTEEEIATNDSIDSEWMGSKIELNVKVTGEQIDKEPMYLAKQLTVGDTVTYNIGTGKIEAGEILPGATLNGAVNASDITEWVVLNIDEATGTTTLRAAEPTTQTLTLTGIDGFNNSKNALNKVSEAFHNENMGTIYARSITMKDIFQNFPKQSSEITTSYTYGCILKNEMIVQSITPKQIKIPAELRQTWDYYNSRPSYSSGNFWIAQHMVSEYEGNIGFYIYCKNNDGVNWDSLVAESTWNIGNITERTKEYAVLPVVYLKSGIVVKKDDNNEKWVIVP